jgi:ABC-2 type transport system permease protein
VTSGRSRSITFGVAQRSIRKLIRSPGASAPTILIPLLLFATVAGAFSAVSQVKGFTYYNYTAFAFVFVVCQAAMFAGAFTALELMEDYTQGIGSRLMLGASQHLAIIAGYVISAVARALVAFAIVGAIAGLTGMPIRGSILQVVAFGALATLLCAATTLYGAGIALRIPSITAGALIFMPVFMILFLTPSFVARSSLSGWLHSVANVNPLTTEFEAGRGFLAADPVSVVPAFAIAVGLTLFFGVFAMRGMRKAERGPGARRERREKGRGSSEARPAANAT